MSDADRKLGEEMAAMHIGGLVELGIIPPPTSPSETDWVRACFAIEGVKEYYKHIQASEGAMESLELIERCLRYGADVIHTTPVKP